MHKIPLKALVLSALLICYSLPGWGQNPVTSLPASTATAIGTTSTPKKIGISFSCTCNDSVGASFATAFRDLLATSPRYYEAYTPIEKLPNGKEIDHWQIKVVSLDPKFGPDGSSSIMSVVFLFGDTYFLEQYVQSCGLDRISQCAHGTLSDFDNLMN